MSLERAKSAVSTKSSKFTPTIDSWIDDETHPSLWVDHSGILHNLTGEVNNPHLSITLQRSLKSS